MSVSNLKENTDAKGVFYIKENNHQIAGFISKINRHSHIEHIIDATFFSWLYSNRSYPELTTPFFYNNVAAEKKKIPLNIAQAEVQFRKN